MGQKSGIPCRVREIHRPVEPMMAALRDLKNAPMETDDQPLFRKIAQYEILEKIGSGDMGVVYRAVHPHPHLKREVDRLNEQDRLDHHSQEFTTRMNQKAKIMAMATAPPAGLTISKG